VIVRRENSEHDENGERHKGLDGFGPPEIKTLRLVCGGIRCEWGSPLEWRSRPPYMAGGLGLCRAYSRGTHARKKEDGLLLEFFCNPTRTRSV
jgi:hypothetical protein